MNIAFRVDASDQIGTGHCMRCLALADALKERGARIRFVSRYMPNHLRELLLARGLEFRLLDGGLPSIVPDALPHAHWLGVAQARDALDTVATLSDQSWDWLVVDNYALDAEWESVARKAARKILAIDDIANRRHDCDVLLDQNLYADMDVRYQGKVPVNCTLLLGPKYALLRDEFRHARERVRARKRPVRRVLVFFGGVDAENFTARAIEALAGIRGHEWDVDVVIGAQHPHHSQIEAACAGQGYIFHSQTNRMAELMAAADLAIGAGGSATWERCCVGLPCIVIAVAQNQVQAATDISDFGAVEFIGVAEEVSLEKLTQAIEKALDGTWIGRASKLGIELVDAKGTSRIVRMMEMK
jgi:UDP-2,4-diacetamido-2,4,6-trideoxy-beta-L-altropyranose hydrolase